MINRVDAFLGVHHVGLTVRNFERSMEFYERLLGKVRDFDTESDGPELSKAVRVENASLHFGFISLGPVHLEILEYRNSRRDQFELRNCDVGASHLCFEVNDLRGLMSELASEGIDFYSDPIEIHDGPLAGYSFVYFDDPDGITLELFEHQKSEQ